MRPLLPLFLLLFLLAGCAPLSTRYAAIPIRIEVRDAATGMPLGDARISGGVNVAFNPSAQPGFLGRPGGVPSFVEINEPSSWTSTTDQAGLTRLSIAGGNPSSITISRDGYETIRSVINAGERLPVNHRLWSEGDQPPRPSESGAGRMEFRVLPAT